MKLESKVFKKTNKYVYFTDGKHINRKDFNALKIMERKEIDKLSLVSDKDQKIYEESLLLHIRNKADWEKKQADLADCAEVQSYYEEAELAAQFNYEEAFLAKSREMDTLRNSFIDKARIVYNSVANQLPTILNDFQEENGVKFIIQENEHGEYRFCFDPYKLVANYHSSLSDVYKDVNWYTINGGWLKVINNTVVLYSKSGDYGVFGNYIAVEAAKILFPNQTIKSFAGVEWKDIP